MERDFMGKGLLGAKKKVIVPNAGFLAEHNIILDDSVEILEERVAFGRGSSVSVRDMCLYRKDKGPIPDLDLQFRCWRGLQNREALLVAEVVGLQFKRDGQDVRYNHDELKEQYNTNGLFVIVGVTDTVLDMASYNANKPKEVKIGVISEYADGWKAAYFFTGTPGRQFEDRYNNFELLNIEVASLINATHVINRNTSFYGLYTVYKNIWPLNNVRFKMFAVDKAIQTTGFGFYRGSRGTRMFGRTLKRNQNRRQRSVCYFDTLSEELRYRYDECASMRILKTKEVEQVYGML